MPDPIKPTQVAMAQAWNAWWSSVSTGANDKHMQVAFEAGFEAGAQQAREQALEALPDEIDLFRLMRGAGRKTIDKARAVDRVLRALKEQPPC